jgi:hypothetical protein
MPDLPPEGDAAACRTARFVARRTTASRAIHIHKPITLADSRARSSMEMIKYRRAHPGHYRGKVASCNQSSFAAMTCATCPLRLWRTDLPRLLANYVTQPTLIRRDECVSNRSNPSMSEEHQARRGCRPRATWSRTGTKRVRVGLQASGSPMRARDAFLR